MMIIKTQVKPTDTWSKKFMQTLQNCYAQSQKRKLDVKTSIIYLNTTKKTQHTLDRRWLQNYKSLPTIKAK